MRFQPKVKITPRMAARMLEKNRENNRRPKPGKISAYARDIKAGRWLLTGETIKFDEEGYLIDGQNRLLAVVEAGTPAEFSIMEGLSPDAMLVMDSGASRSFGDVLAIGFATPDKFHVGAVVRWILAIDGGLWRGTGGGYNPTHAELVGRYAQDSPAFDSAGTRSRDVYRAALGTAAPAGTAHYLFSKIDEEETKIFFDALVSGANLLEGQPVLTLRNRLIRARLENISRPDQLALYIRAWNATRRGEPLKKIYSSPTGKLTNENFPRPR